MRVRTTSPARAPFAAAFTLTEILISMTVIMMVMAGVLTTHLFGMRMFELTRIKLGASDSARTAISKLILEVRSAKLIRLGSGSVSSFTEVAPNTAQLGSAIEIYPTTSSNSYIRYFRNAVDSTLQRMTNGSSAATVVATGISNTVVFASEDFAGNVLTNNENNRVISLTLQFFQLLNPNVPIGPGNYYDFYQLRTKITRRTVE